MTTQQSAVKDQEMVDEKAVIAYLRHHPEFFEENENLLAELKISHPTHGAVSLIERQVEVLREQRTDMMQKLNELIDNARRNETLIESLHKLTLALISAPDMSTLFQVLDKGVRHFFKADAATLRLFVEPPGDYTGKEFADLDDVRLAKFESVFNAPAPLCGRLDDELLDYLFGTDASDVASAAIIPLRRNKLPFGVLAIGSSDPENFHAAMGTVFLKQLGEILTRLLQPHLPE